MSEAVEARLSPVLDRKTIHVWSVRLEAGSGAYQALETALSLEERDRCARFRFEHLRRAYVIEHGLLRCLLGAYLECDGSGIRFRQGEFGKPYVAVPAVPGLQFNMSHSGGLVAVAVAAEFEVGVDIELRRPMDDIAAIARNYFSNGELSDLMGLPDTEKNLGFFRCWSRKEAFLKATGAGLSFGLDRFRVSLASGVAAAVLAIDGREPECPWQMREFQPTEEHAGAVAWVGRPVQVAHELFDSAEACLARLG